jgi:hypothetical protein
LRLLLLLKNGLVGLASRSPSSPVAVAVALEGDGGSARLLLTSLHSAVALPGVSFEWTGQPVDPPPLGRGSGHHLAVHVRRFGDRNEAREEVHLSFKSNSNRNPQRP